MNVTGIIRAPVTDRSTRALTCPALANLVSRIADRYELPLIPERMLRQSCYTDTVSIPVIMENRNGILWADRFYAAYLLNTGEFRYFYLTYTHITEETFGYREAARQRETPDRMPPEIRKTFNKALGDMRKSKYWVWFDSDVIRVAA